MSEKNSYSLEYIDYLQEKRSHNKELKVIVNIMANLLENTKFTKKKAKAPLSFISILEQLSAIKSTSVEIQDFIVDELLFEKSLKLDKLKISKRAY